jgi:hypothetical protein
MRRSSQRAWFYFQPEVVASCCLFLALALVFGAAGRAQQHVAAAVITGSAAAATPGATAPRVPVVVELFTSEGCSSCPPADELLSQLDRLQPIPGAEVIALGEHVDYWDQLGWKDRFSSPMYTSRQQEYGRRFGMASVYTPQMVVNGQAELVGSDGRRAQSEITRAAQGPKARVELAMSGGDVLNVKVENLPPGTRDADMLLAVTETGIESNPNRGENRGHRLQHTGVVRSMTNLGRLEIGKTGGYSAEALLNLKPEWRRENLKVVLFVQDRGNRKILGAAALKL